MKIINLGIQEASQTTDNNNKNNKECAMSHHNQFVENKL